MKRKSEVSRTTKETHIVVRLGLDGMGKATIKTSIPFLDHMLSLFAAHSGFDLYIEAKGDLGVDSHHLIEDIGLALGGAINKALGRREGIRRYGSLLLPMDETLVQVAIDISGRPYLNYNGPKRGKIGEMRVGLVEDFLRAMVMEARLTLHVTILYGDDLHHKIEAVFKGVGRAIGDAVSMNPRIKGIPSTKGTL
jgi:imidazoleglycerol-phosphate dehydratase